MKRVHIPRSPVHTALWIDAAFELVAGVALLTLNAQFARWLEVERSFVIAGGAVFLVAAVAIGAVALGRRPARPLISGLAAVNLIGGLAFWCAVGVAWREISAEGRWVAAALADSFIAVAVLEFLALRRAQPFAESTD